VVAGGVGCAAASLGCCVAVSYQLVCRRQPYRI